MMMEDKRIHEVYLRDIKSKRLKHKKCFSGIKFGQKFNKNSGIYTNDLCKKYKAV
jgi:hypothetical protein